MKFTIKHSQISTRLLARVSHTFRVTCPTKPRRRRSRQESPKGYEKCGLVAACALVTFLPAIATAQKSDPAEPAVEKTDHRPEKFSPGRYRATFSTSAFEREILPPAKVDNTPPPTPFDLKVVGVTGEEGRYRVTLIDKKGKYVVVTDQPNGDGYRYASVEPAANIADFRVQIAKDGQTEWAEFDDRRYSIASKAVAPKKSTGRPARRPAIVPNKRTGPPARAPIPQSKTAKAAAERAGKSAINALNASAARTVNGSAANAANAQGTKESSKRKSNVSGRRVVLPPSSR